MISSPGAVYGREAISYTTDTCPITLEWFDLEDRAYLSESSQIYLELALMQSGVDRVCASYNSFRKEEADATHLSEFHHVEFEGHVSQDENLDIIGAMLYRAVADVIRDCPRELATFIGDDRIAELSDTFARPIPRIAFKDVLDELYKATRHDLYREFTLKHFGPWEEVLITEIIGGPVAILDMPLYEVPFYHAQKRGTEAPIADNADVIWPGYRETVGSGHRVGTLAELEHKASKFDLPRDDYEPYLSSRRSPKYEQSSGFGMGLERLLHGMLELPYIHYATLFPRVHVSLTP